MMSRIFIVLAMTLGTLITRFLPFIIFRDDKKIPKFIEYLSNTLPFASMGLLIVYCIKDVNFISSPFGFPELISIFVVAILHHLKHNIFLSIISGTTLYMFLVQVVI